MIMGRKKKSNSEEVTNNLGEVGEDTSTTIEAVLDELALGIAKVKGGWAVVEIAYNAETGESDLQDVRVAGISRDDAIELFKITAVEKGIV